MPIDRILLHLTDGTRRVVEPLDVYYLEADGGDTLVRLRGRRRLRDARSVGNLIRRLARWGFVRIHRDFAVNLRRVRELRPQKDGSGWEVKLEPPVNVVLPVSRRQGKRVLNAFG